MQAMHGDDPRNWMPEKGNLDPRHLALGWKSDQMRCDGTRLLRQLIQVHAQLFPSQPLIGPLCFHISHTARTGALKAVDQGCAGALIPMQVQQIHQWRRFCRRRRRRGRVVPQVEAALGELQLGVVGIGGSQAGVAAVEGDRLLQLLRHGQRPAAPLPPLLRPGAEPEGLTHPWMDRQAELAEMFVGIEQLSWWRQGLIELCHEPAQQLIQSQLGGVIDGVHQRQPLVLCLDPVGKAEIAVLLALAQFGQGVPMGVAQQLGQGGRARRLEQLLGAEILLGGGHRQEVVVRAQR